MMNAIYHQTVKDIDTAAPDNTLFIFVPNTKMAKGNNNVTVDIHINRAALSNYVKDSALTSGNEGTMGFYVQALVNIYDLGRNIFKKSQKYAHNNTSGSNAFSRTARKRMYKNQTVVINARNTNEVTANKNVNFIDNANATKGSGTRTTYTEEMWPYGFSTDTHFDT